MTECATVDIGLVTDKVSNVELNSTLHGEYTRRMHHIECGFLRRICKNMSTTFSM